MGLLNDKTGYDVTFKVGPGKERIDGYKRLLIARSPVFKVMFEDRWNTTETKNDETDDETSKHLVVLPDVAPEAFHNFLQFIYSDMLCVNSIVEVEQLLYLAEKYDVALLKRKCGEILESKLEMKNVIEIHTIASTYVLSSLLKRANELIENEFELLIYDTSFQSIDADLLKVYVASEDIRVTELELFNALIKWAESKCAESDIEPTTGENLRDILGDILTHIRFPLMSDQEFRAYVMPIEILTNDETSTVLEYINLDYADRFSFDAKRLKFKFNDRRGLIDRMLIDFFLNRT